MIKVLIMMSTYNGERYIREQIESIINQIGDFKLTLIVRDDGSTDGTIDILNEYSDKGMLQWYTGKNIKPGLSFLSILHDNIGFDYYAFADQDDFWNPDKISIGIEKINSRNTPTLYFSNAECVDENMKSYGFNTYKRDMKLDFYSVTLAPCFLGCTMIFNKALAEIIQYQEMPKCVTLHDAFLAKVCISLGGLIIYDSTPHIKYRQHSRNVEGATTGKLNALKRRIKMVMYPNKPSFSIDAREILQLYIKNNNTEEYKWLKDIEEYNCCLKNRIKLSISPKPSFISKNIEITMRLQILFGHY